MKMHKTKGLTQNYAIIQSEYAPTRRREWNVYYTQNMNKNEICMNFTASEKLDRTGAIWYTIDKASCRKDVLP